MRSLFNGKYRLTLKYSNLLRLKLEIPASGLTRTVLFVFGVCRFIGMRLYQTSLVLVLPSLTSQESTFRRPIFYLVTTFLLFSMDTYVIQYPNIVYLIQDSSKWHFTQASSLYCCYIFSHQSNSYNTTLKTLAV